MSHVPDEFNDLFGEGAPPSSALDAPLTLTTFRSVRDLDGVERKLSLRELAEEAHLTEAESKVDLPLLVLGRFGNDRGQGVSRRNAGNLQAVFGVEGDHDAGSMTLSEAAGRLAEAGLAALLYETPSSRPEAPRWRVLAPTSRPVSLEERKDLVARLDAVLEGSLAAESYRPAQAYHYGRLTGSAGAASELVEGRPIDQATELAARAPATVGGLQTETELLAGIATGQAFHQGLTSLIGRWLRQGSDPEACATRARAAMDAVPQGERDARWRQRFRDIPRLVRDIAKREAKRSAAEAEALQNAFDDLPDLPDLPPAPTRLRLLRPSDCASAPSRGYLVKGLVAPRDVGCIFGPPGAGKSLLSPLLGYHVALGRAVFGLRTKPGRVLYVAAEDPHGMAGRVRALRQRYGDAPEFILVDGVADLLSTPSDDLRDLRAHVRDLQPSLIFIDTLAMAFPGLEENSAEAMGRVVTVARKLTETGAAVVLVHHNAKSKDGTPRGHSLLNGALDVALQLRDRDEEGVIRAELTKNRNGRSDFEFAFRIGVERFDLDEDGDRIEAPLAEPLEGGAAARRPKLKRVEASVLKILKNGSDALGRMREDAFREACIASNMVSTAEKPEDRARAFRRAVQGLEVAGLVRFATGRAILCSSDEAAAAIGRDAFEDLD
jgi:predicted nuclease with RNAse H fold